MNTYRVALVLLVACGDSTGSSTASSSTDAASTDQPTTGLGASESSGTSTSETPPDFPPPDPLLGHMPCPDGECPYPGVCARLEGASICGPGCQHYGPTSGHCPDSQGLAAFCPYDFAGETPCLLGCATTADCPAEGMVCLPCEPPYAEACKSLNGFLGFIGASMCAWPNP